MSIATVPAMRIVSLNDAAQVQTPNAVMYTYASPEQGGCALAVWRTEMAPGAAGPPHALSTELVVVVLAGVLTLESQGEVRTLQVGDGATVPAHVVRQVRNAGDEPVLTLSAGLPNATARAGDADPVPVPWTR